MALSQRLEIRQTQSLVMTPQLMQAIKLLQLSNHDVAAFVEAEIERNPLLERDEGEEGATDRAAAEPEAEAAGDDGSGEAPDGAPDVDTGIDNDSVAPDRTMGEVDADLSNEFQDDTPTPASEQAPSLPAESWSSPAAGQRINDSAYNLEAFVASEPSLADHLDAQLGLVVHDPTRQLIARAIIRDIDEAGYYRGDLAAVAEQLGADGEEVLAALNAVQTLEPTGVGARDLAECLAAQLRERDRFDPAMATLVAHLDLVARRDHTRLRALCGVDADDLAAMLDELKTLDPKPGHRFGGGPVQVVVPDVTVRAAADGGWRVELNQETLPRVLVDRTYMAAIGSGPAGERDRAFLTDCLQSANWLVKSLDQRARTILKVASEIVRQQDAFLVHGVQHLRPLNLKAVADAIDMHESTVSRVTSNKFMATPRGVFELKFFFTAAIASSEGGEAHSAEAVRDRIRRMIDNESPQAVLSDDAIVKALDGDGIEIARRTVAKYRESMRIASSVQRRREKQAAL